MKNFQFSILLISLSIGSISLAEGRRPLTELLGLPTTASVLMPLPADMADSILSSIVAVLEPDCKRVSQMPESLRGPLSQACLLGPARDYLAHSLAELENNINRPLRLPLDTLLSNYDLIRSGAWSRSQFVRFKPGQDAYSLATNLLLAKITIEKALYAYIDLANFWSHRQNNNAKIYIVPKLIQTMESSNILQSLFERYQNMRCTPNQMLTRPGGDLCQIEKSRTGYLLDRVLRQNKDGITNALRMVIVSGQEADLRSVAQISELIPLSDMIENLRSTDVSAVEVWSAIGNESSLTRINLRSRFENLTRLPIQISNHDQVRAYVFSSYALSLQSLLRLSEQVAALGSLYTEIDPQFSNDSSLVQLDQTAKKQIDELVSAISFFVTRQEQAGDLQ